MENLKIIRISTDSTVLTMVLLSFCLSLDCMFVIGMIYLITSINHPVRADELSHHAEDDLSSVSLAYEKRCKLLNYSLWKEDAGVFY